MIRRARISTFALAATFAAGAALAGPDGLTVTLTDGVVSPQTIEVPAGKATVLTVVNAGKKPAEFESKKLHIEQLVAPGATLTLRLRPLPAGEYPFVEEFHENLDTSRGTIVVK